MREGIFLSEKLIRKQTEGQSTESHKTFRISEILSNLIATMRRKI